MDYYSLFWGTGVISTINEPLGAFTFWSSTLAILVDSDPFHGLLLTVLGPQTGFVVVEPKVRLRVGHQHSQFLPILARFVYYYSLFWGPVVISMINEPWGAFTFRSSTLAVFIDSDPFYGQLLTVLGPQSDFHCC